MTLHVTTTSIGGRLHQLLVYSDGTFIGEYERSQEQDIERKKREIANAEAMLLEVFRKHGPFVVRWNRESRKKSIRVNDIEVGVVPKSAWESPSWESGGPRGAGSNRPVALDRKSEVAPSVEQSETASRSLPSLNERLRQLLLEAYRPCPGFSGPCREMRWNPAAGHVPRGFCGATGKLSEVELVLVVAEPGDPHVGEAHPVDPGAGLESTFQYSYRCLETCKDLYHRNVRLILNLCFPGASFSEQMRRTWKTESVLCSAAKEGGSVPRPVETECRQRYLERQLDLFPDAVVVALGGKAAKRIRGREFISAFAAAPPGCNFKGARESWEAVAETVQAARGRR